MTTELKQLVQQTRESSYERYEPLHKSGHVVFIYGFISMVCAIIIGLVYIFAIGGMENVIFGILYGLFGVMIYVSCTLLYLLVKAIIDLGINSFIQLELTEKQTDLCSQLVTMKKWELSKLANQTDQK